MEKLPVSSRRGRNFLLHNLEESDVVFGTKGNGRNEIFLKVLERHSQQYVELSKFQKMGLIQKIIREWKGNFYIMNPKTNDLCLAKKKNHNLSTADPSSRKLYTSVRRMMNYVNSKVQRQPYHPPRSESIGASALIPTPSTTGTMIPTSHVPRINSVLAKNEHKPMPRDHALLRRADIPNVATNKKQPTVMTAIDYIRKNHVTLPLPETRFSAFSSSSTPGMSISPPKRSMMLVTPEPSPRTMLQNPPSVSPIPLSKHVFAKTSANLAATSLPALTPMNSMPTSSTTTIIPPKIEAKNSFSKKQQAATATITARNKKIKKHLHVADNSIGDLEESAIMALTSLCSMSRN